MDELDDLLGGDSAVAQKTNTEIDDLLGDGGAASSTGGGGEITLDDDLLFGDAPAASSSSSSKKKKDAIADDDDDLLGSASPSKAPSSPSLKPSGSDSKKSKSSNALKKAASTVKPSKPRSITYPPMVTFPDTLVPLANSIADVYKAANLEAPPPLPSPPASGSPAIPVYFARFLQLVEKDNKRCVVILIMTATHILQFSADAKPGQVPQRIVEVSKVFGIVTQSVLATKLFGNKENELHILIQISGELDMHVALHRDSLNGFLAEPSRDGDILHAIAGVTYPLGINLPISSLKENEAIDKMVMRVIYNGKRHEETLRKQESEVLAFRTELLSECNKLKRENQNVDMQIETIKASSAGQTLANLQTEIAEHEKTIANFKKSNDVLEKKKIAADREVEKLNADIAEEAAHRQQSAQATLKAAQNEQTSRQVAEYEQMKRAHKREMDKQTTLISFTDRRVQAAKARGKNLSAVPDLTSRIATLEDEERFVSENIKVCKDHHTRQLSSLASAKKNLAAGKAALEKLLQEINALKEIKANGGKEIPSSISREEVPRIEVPSTNGVVVAAAQANIATTIQSVNVANNKPAISLDDSDDDLVVAPAAGGGAAAPAAKPPIDLDDDEI